MAMRQVIRKGILVSFETPYSDSEAFGCLVGLIQKGDTFAEDLYNKGGQRGSLLTPKQVDWVHKLFVDAETPDIRPAARQDLSKIIELFKTAKTSLKRPAITFSLDGLVVRLSLAGDTSKNPGCVYSEPAGA